MPKRNDDVTSVTADLDINDLAYLLEAVGTWEREYSDEHDTIKHLLEFDPDDAPIPDDHRERFNEYVEGLKKRLKRRSAELSNLSPTRFEQATFLKTKLIMAKRKQISELADKLGEPDPLPAPDGAVDGAVD